MQDDAPHETSTPAAGVPVWLLIATTVVGGTALPIGLHRALHDTVNGHQIAMAFFFWLNTIIAFWEICLFLHIDGIRDRYERYVVQYRGREFDRILDFFRARLSLGRVVSTETWADVWASYSLFDESYASKTSYGFFIDIGNGFSTLLPSLLFLYGITFQPCSARALGLIGLLISYQMLYGTLVYFWSFMLNRRYQGHSLPTVAAFVGLSNGLWTVFPLWAIGLSITMIYSDDFSVFGG